MYERGCGVIRNASQSRAWFLKAAEQGDAGAQFHLGMSCHRETFDPARTDSVECKIEALKWLLMAAAQEYQNAEASCNGLILKMSHEELAESNRRMAALRERMQMALPVAEPLTHS
jgi:TPR repeat protein